MAVTLTTEWQTVASTTWAPGTGFSVSFYLDAKHTVQSVENNATSVYTRLRSVVNAGSGSGYNYAFSLSLSGGLSGSGLWTLATETILNGEDTIKHNPDGTKTITLSASASISGIGMNVSMSENAIIPTIKRYPMITSAPDFNDDQNPTITYTKTLGFSSATVQAAIYNTAGTVAYANYRNITVANGSYQFNLTTAEKNALRNATPNSKTMSVKFVIRTTANGTNYYSSVTRTLTIINGTPTYEHAEQEQNAKVVTVLGTNAGNTIIQNASILRTTITPSAKKGATIKNVRVACGSSYIEYKTASPYQFNIPANSLADHFSITVVDSRDFQAIDVINKTLISYTPISIQSLSFARESPTSSNIIVNLQATYYQQTFGSTVNVPTVKWKLGSGSETTIPSSNYVINNTTHKLTITNYKLTNALVYTSDGQFTLTISDLLTSASDKKTVLKGIPTIDIGEHDLRVNGTLYVADTNRANAVNVLSTINALKPKTLWTNSNPTSSFTAKSVTLSSSDYDILEIYYYNWTTQPRIVSQRYLKGYNGVMMAPIYYDSKAYVGVREFDYSSATSLSFKTARSFISNSAISIATADDWMVPIKILGYKN